MLCAHYRHNLNQLKRGFSSPGVLFIISSSFLASCYYIRVSNHNVSIDFFFEPKRMSWTLFMRFCLMHTFPLDKGGGEHGLLSDRWGVLLCFLWVGGSCLLVLLWFLAPGKQMKWGMLGFFGSCCCRGNRGIWPIWRKGNAGSFLSVRGNSVKLEYTILVASNKFSHARRGGTCL